ncbi:MAG: CvpA family protein [Planctomycetota bacterium]
MTLLEQLNWIDLCLILALLGCLLVGFGMGFYRQLAIAASLIVGFVAASQLAQPLARSEWFERVHAEIGQSGAEGVAYATVLLGSLLVGLACLLIFRSFFGSTLKFIDSLLGAVLGTAVGCLVFGLFAMGVYHFEDSQFHRPIQQSLLGSRIAEGVRVGSRLMPEELRTRIEAGVTKAAAEAFQDDPSRAPGRHGSSPPHSISPQEAWPEPDTPDSPEDDHPVPPPPG